jgi:phage terminase large subunit-like protein
VTPKWSTACPDWQERIRARRSLIPCLPLFPKSAREASKVYQALRIVDAPGSPTMKDACRPWTFSFVEAIFGAYDSETGRRLIQEFFWLISKKNIKSTTAAGVMMTALILNWRQSAEYLILAPTIEVANNSFFPARDMVKADDELREMMHVQEHYRTITHRGTGAQLKVVAADNEAVSGKKATGIFVDELWLFGKRPGAENMLREAIGGLASRPEGFVVYASTQSDEPPAGVFRQKLDYARQVRDGTIVDPKFMPVLYEFPQAMIDAGEHLEPKNFYVTNPNLGLSVDEEFLARELTKAQAGGPESLIGFAAKHLDIEIGLNLRADRWTGADYWLRQTDRTLTLDAVLERSEVLTIGIDGGGLDDMLGFAVLGRTSEGRWLVWSHAWIHPIALERRKAEAPRYLGFETDGDLTICKSIGDDVQEVATLAQRCEDSGKLDKLGVDPVGIGSIVDALEAIGLGTDRILGISQGWKMSGAIKTAERRLAEGALWHGGAPLMAWCTGNAKVEPKGNAVTITKQAAGFAKIDPLMALFNAVALMSMNPEPRGMANYFTFLARRTNEATTR